ncbi:MAG: glycogen debranching protein GlgX, partial [Stellaceae bacterium]
VNALRGRQQRNLLATLLLSQGIPMLTAGDEMGRTQGGNNNAYCQDNDISWAQWQKLAEKDRQLLEFVRHLIHLRRTHRVFSRPRFLRGEVLSEAGVKDITWVTPDGAEASGEDWGNPVALVLGYVLSGAAGEFFTPGGQRDIDESFLVMINAYSGDLDFRIPELAAPMVWEPLVDTAEPTGRATPGTIYAPGEVYALKARSLVLFVNRAPRPEMPPVAEPAGIEEAPAEALLVEEADAAPSS